MFPKKIQFMATPLLLQQAVDTIEEPKGRLRRRQSTEDAFKEKILQIPTEQLQKWKMKPAMLRMLPLLATDKRNTLLQEKVLTIAIASIQNFDEQTHRRLIPLLWENRDFRMAINAQFAKKPPSRGWLGMYYKSFRAVEPIQEIIETIPTDIPLNRLHLHLEMNTANPIFQAICHVIRHQVSSESMKSWSWEDLVQWLKSGYARTLRWELWKSLVQEYGSKEIPMEHVVSDTKLFQLLRIGVSISTKREREELNVVHQQWLSWIVWDQTIESRCPSQVHQLWKPWLHHIEGLEIHRPSGWICIVLANHVFIWSMASYPVRFQIVSRVDFRNTLMSSLRISTPFLLRNIESEELVSQVSTIQHWMIRCGYPCGVQ